VGTSKGRRSPVFSPLATRPHRRLCSQVGFADPGIHWYPSMEAGHRPNSVPRSGGQSTSIPPPIIDDGNADRPLSRDVCGFDKAHKFGHEGKV